MMRIVKNKKDDAASIAFLLDKVKYYGGIDYAQRRMREWQDASLEALNALPEGPSRKALAELVEYIGNRVR